MCNFVYLAGAELSTLAVGTITVASRSWRFHSQQDISNARPSEKHVTSAAGRREGPKNDKSTPICDAVGTQIDAP